MGKFKNIFNPWKVALYIQWRLERKGFFNNWDDEKFLNFVYYIRFRKKLNIKNPQTFNEKLQWLKLYDRRPEYVRMVDKYEVKEYVAGIIGEEYIIPTLGVWDNFNDIDFTKLPNKFVLKCTHDSGGIVICKDRKSFSIDAARRKIETSLNTNYFFHGREWPYKNVKPRIIAEYFLEDKNKSEEIADYKIHCFNGEPRFVLVCTDRNSEGGLKEDFYDINWSLMNMARPNHPNSNKKHLKPVNYEKMLQISKLLSKDMPFCRIDFYEVNSDLYFGEITLYPASGFSEFAPASWDKILGSWININ